MKLIQILLPLYKKDGEAIAAQTFLEVRNELADKFGGITTYTRSPAKGLWKDEEEKTVKDDIVIYEVMTNWLDKSWWKPYKEHLEGVFQQDQILIRIWEVEEL